MKGYRVIKNICGAPAWSAREQPIDAGSDEEAMEIAQKMYDDADVAGLMDDRMSWDEYKCFQGAYPIFFLMDGGRLVKDYAFDDIQRKMDEGMNIHQVRYNCNETRFVDMPDVSDITDIPVHMLGCPPPSQLSFMAEGIGDALDFMETEWHAKTYEQKDRFVHDGGIFNVCAEGVLVRDFVQEYKDMRINIKWEGEE